MKAKKWKKNKILYHEHMLPKMYNFRFSLALGLCITGFLICITIFVLVYKNTQHQTHVKETSMTVLPIKQETKKEANFIAVGDIMLSRTVADKAKKS